MRFISIPLIAKMLYSKAKKNFPEANGKIFFTFDDGPNPEITPQILDLLKQFNAKATFFCLGKNVEQFPNLFERMKQEGHSVGNHTYNHINGFSCSTPNYIEDVAKAQQFIRSPLFRPPYGKMKLSQYKNLAEDYKIILWDVMSYDFDPSLNAIECEALVKKHAKDGSIIVFHDSVKAKQNLISVLPNLLKYYSTKGFSFEPISEIN